MSNFVSGGEACFATLTKLLPLLILQLTFMSFVIPKKHSGNADLEKLRILKEAKGMTCCLAPEQILIMEKLYW